jgi:hypothetical protein
VQPIAGREAYVAFLLQVFLVPLLLLLLARFPRPQSMPQTTHQIDGPLVASRNPNYFRDAKGNVLILSGSQTWNTLQDWGGNGSPQVLDFNAFIRFLAGHGHNFTLLWRVEMPKFCSLPVTQSSPPDFTVSPQPWLRTGPGKATDDHRWYHDEPGGISVLDASGALIPAARAILESVAEGDGMVSTGHLSPREASVLIRRAHQCGVRKVLVTHLFGHVARIPLSVSELAILRPLTVIRVQSSGEIQAIRQY